MDWKILLFLVVVFGCATATPVNKGGRKCPADPCKTKHGNQRCKNKGRCVEIETPPFWQCKCPQGRRGKVCQIIVPGKCVGNKCDCDKQWPNHSTQSSRDSRSGKPSHRVKRHQRHWRRRTVLTSHRWGKIPGSDSNSAGVGDWSFSSDSSSSDSDSFPFYRHHTDKDDKGKKGCAQGCWVCHNKQSWDECYEDGEWTQCNMQQPMCEAEVHKNTYGRVVQVSSRCKEKQVCHRHGQDRGHICVRQKSMANAICRNCTETSTCQDPYKGKVPNPFKVRCRPYSPCQYKGRYARCKNRGKCIYIPVPPFWSCDCSGTGYTGYRCEKPDRPNPCDVKRVDGGWSSWGSWTECVVGNFDGCGVGKKYRYRTCTNPPPTYNGKDCRGRDCDIEECDVDCSGKPCRYGGLKCTVDNSHCVVTPFRRRCVCDRGYVKFRGLCVREDGVPCWGCGTRCTDRNSHCDRATKRCVCNEGYVPFGIAGVCTDADVVPCAYGGTRCQEHAVCDLDVKKCTCETGYEPSGDTCIAAACHQGGSVCPAHSHCKNKECICDDGYVNYNRACKDKSKIPCNLGGTKCADVNSYCDPISCTCKCKRGYVLYKGSCKDISTIPCQHGGTRCESAAYCVRRKKFCKCKKGYVKYHGICTDIKKVPCQYHGLKCPSRSSCDRAQLKCMCKTGYIYYNGKCKPLDKVPCEHGGRRCYLANSKCNTERRTCECVFGYVLYYKACKPKKDVPCEKGGIKCVKQDTYCDVEKGQCVCDPCTVMYQGECRDKEKVPCSAGGVKCTKCGTVCNMKRKRCQCKAGLINYHNVCTARQDVPCSAGGRACGVHAKCAAKTCRCLSGYVKFGGRCTAKADVPCKNGGERCPANSQCNVARTVCECVTGYIKVQGSCVPTNIHCGPGYTCSLAHASCVNNICVCKAGYVLHDQTCKAKSSVPCESGGSKCVAGATCEADTKKCECKYGYLPYKGKCTEQENVPCEAGGFVCTPHAYCKASGECVCLDGYVKRKGLCIDDYDPCDQDGDNTPCAEGGNKCTTPHTHCEDFKCVCNLGYVLYQGECKPRNNVPCDKGGRKCDDIHSQCDGTSCQCNYGYILYKGVCTDEDHVPCEAGGKKPCGANAQCKNRVCVCDEGYVMYLGSCVEDKNVPCQNGGEKCDTNEVCNEDTKTCECVAGTIRYNQKCTDENEVPCSHMGKKCMPNAHCFTSRKKCVCNPGYNRFGDHCVSDGEPCKLGGKKCGSNAHCVVSHDGSRSCVCYTGYTMVDGVCKAKCGQPCPISHGSVTTSGPYVAGNVAKYVCDSGYYMTGYDSITCLDNGQWTPLTAVCKAECETPDNIPHGSISASGPYYAGVVVKYTCDSGYKLFGKASITCQDNGLWTPTLAQCKDSCSEPTPIANGVVSSTGPYYAGDKATYTCKDTYTLTGDSTITCKDGGVWTPTTAMCKAECSEPPTITHGSFSTSEPYITGVVTTYTCDDGFSLIGSNTITCQSNHKWSPAPPQCKAKCSDPSPIPYGSVSSTGPYVAGDKATFVCQSGYHLIGDNTITCKNDGTWTPTQAVCKGKCDAPPSISHGSVSASEPYVTGSTATYSCDYGFKLVGSSTVTCQNTGQWSPAPPTCKAKCSDPSPIPHGSVSSTGPYVAGDKATFVCQSGYHLIGDNTITCKNDGTWTPTQAVCKVKCGAPPSISHGSVSASEPYVTGSTATYSCDYGFKLVGSSTVTCQNTGEWSPAPPTCKAKCSDPSPIPYGSVSSTGPYVAGDEATFVCQSGYHLIGDDTITCKNDGTWTPTQAVCKGKCDAPPSISHGSVSASEPYVTGSTATYSCDYGFKLVGSSTVTCQNTGEWSPAPPTCKAKCSDPTPIPYGSVSSTGPYVAGDKATFVCQSGYHLIGDDTITCKNDGTWTPTQAVCKGKCDAPPSISHGSVSASEPYVTGSTATYSCDYGFKLVGSSTVTCQNTGEWSPAPPTCKAKCSDPTPIPYGSVSSTGPYVAGDKATFVCQSGYHLIGDDTITCKNDGTWTPTQAVCKGKCDAPPSISHGSVSASEPYVTGSTATYSCDYGFKLVGSSTVTCQNTGQWSPAPPICKAKCSDPSPIPHGSVSSTGPYVAGDQATFVCQSGYHLIGDDTITCKNDGTWTPTQAVCKVKCGTPPSISHGSVSASEPYVTGSTATYSCDYGFKLVGSSTVTCQNTGEWSPAPPICKAKCSDPTPIPHGSVSSTGPYVAGDKATFVCQSGYHLIGDDTITCKNDGTWTPTQAVCKGKCGAPPSISHGSVSASEPYVTGSTATYSCDYGFKLVGSSTVTCQNTGEWSPAPPTCKAKCSDPSPIPYGSVSSTGPYVAGDKATFVCQSGYHLIGDDTITCKNDGTWTPTQAVCKVKCDAPQSISHGSVSASEPYVTGSTATYSCDYGFKLVGSSTVTCQNTGEWSPAPPTCKAKCSDPSPIPHGSVSSTGPYVAGDKATFVCQSGYHLIGDDTITCKNDGTWTPTQAVCKVKCGAPLSISHGSVSASEPYVTGSTATYSCDYGFKLVGSSTVTCQNTGEWSPAPPTCKAKCSDPSPIPYGSVSSTGPYVAGDKATFVCQSGYHLIGDDTITCKNDGTWTPTQAVCKGKCGAPSSISHGSVSASEPYVTGSTATYSCDYGFKLVGSSTVTCQNTGEWSPAPPTCKAMCSNPDAIPHGSVSTSGPYIAGDVAKYACDKDYVLIGSDTITCQATGEWTSTLAVCKANCGTPPTLPHGSFTASPPYVAGVVAKYECDEGYNIHGWPKVKCQENGEWTNLEASCKGTCGDPTPIANGAVSSTGPYEEGDEATFVCNTGFELTGSNKITCQGLNTWSPTQAVCTDINECASAPCHNYADCTNIPGSFGCKCKTGYVGDGFTCEPDDCANGGTRCGTNEECDKTQKKCVCIDGYILYEKKCTDKDEVPCMSGGTKCGQYGTCNTATRNCVCQSGYHEVDGVCKLKNQPCEDGGLNCMDNAHCVQRVTRVCECDADYVMVNGVCKPKDTTPCSDGGNYCHKNAHCTTYGGVRNCTCDDGYMQDGDQCTFSAVEWCDHCLTTRNGNSYNEDPEDCTKFFQCIRGNPISYFHHSCSACTYWNQNLLTCVSLDRAVCPTGAPPMSKHAHPQQCSSYFECHMLSPTRQTPYIQRCCSSGQSFNYTQQRCVSDTQCTDACVISTTPQTTTQRPSDVVGPTCVDSNGFRREQIASEPYSYWLVSSTLHRIRKESCGSNMFNLTSCSCSVVTDSCLLVYMKLNADIKDYNNFATYIDPGSVTVVNNAAWFPGNSHIELPVFSNYEFSNTFAISLWYNSQMGNDDKAGLITNGDCLEVGSINIWVESNSVLGGYVTENDNTNTSIKITGTATQGVWHHVVMTYNGVEIFFYVDNSLVGRHATTGGIARTHNPMAFGLLPYVAGCDSDHYKGYMSQVKLFKCHLTISQVATLFSYGKGF